jgi:hypothetical protein
VQKYGNPALRATSATIPFDPAGAIIAAFATNNRTNIYRIENVLEEAWRATPPGERFAAADAVIGTSPATAMLSRQTGHPAPQSVMFGLWEWGTR